MLIGHLYWGGMGVHELVQTSEQEPEAKISESLHGEPPQLRIIEWSDAPNYHTGDVQLSDGSPR